MFSRNSVRVVLQGLVVLLTVSTAQASRCTDEEIMKNAELHLSAIEGYSDCATYSMSAAPLWSINRSFTVRVDCRVITNYQWRGEEGPDDILRVQSLRSKVSLSSESCQVEEIVSQSYFGPVKLLKRTNADPNN